MATRDAFDAAQAGWHDAGNHLMLAKSGSAKVTAAKTFVFRFQKR